VSHQGDIAAKNHLCWLSVSYCHWLNPNCTAGAGRAT
jgi:hypothetical protein